MKSFRIALVLASLTLFALPAAAADAPKVLSVLAVKVKGDPTAYLQRLKQYEAIFVAMEFANLEAFAKAQTKLQADDEANKIRKEMDASGLREVVDNSLFVDVTP